MKVDRDVILDLLPLYVEGEASEETRRLVEENLAADAELQALYRSMRQHDRTLRASQSQSLDKIEKSALERTRKALRRKNIVLGIALAYFFAPLSFVYRHGHFTWIMIRDNRDVAFDFLAISLVLWVVYLVLWREARAAKL
ncbi:MAG: hypothetical protein ACLQKA_23700 [Bryobacteraceae bacterium]